MTRPQTPPITYYINFIHLINPAILIPFIFFAPDCKVDPTPDFCRHRRGAFSTSASDDRKSRAFRFCRD